MRGFAIERSPCCASVLCPTPLPETRHTGGNPKPKIQIVIPPESPESLRSWQRWASALTLATCIACAPLDPPMRSVTGRWQVECEGGTETLDLRPDGRYTYTIESPQRQTTVEGTWSVEAPHERLAGALIVLRNAPASCEKTGAFRGKSSLFDNSLAPVREWGRTELKYHPDLDGFRKVSSSSE